MTTLLITPAEVLALAFPSAEYLREDTILPSKIETAQLRFLQPVFGPLYDRLGESRYGEFTDRYVKPALACYVRCLVIAGQGAAAGATGTMRPRTEYASDAGARTLTLMAAQARCDADTLLEQALRHVELHPDRFPEYDPERNIRKKILIKGGFIL